MIDREVSEADREDERKREKHKRNNHEVEGTERVSKLELDAHDRPANYSKVSGP